MPKLGVKPPKIEKNRKTATRKSRIPTLIILILTIGAVIMPIFTAKFVSAVDQPNINVQPEAPEGVAEGGVKFLNVLYYFAWLLVIGGGALGVILLLAGKKNYAVIAIFVALVGAIILKNWESIVNYFTGDAILIIISSTTA